MKGFISEAPTGSPYFHPESQPLSTICQQCATMNLGERHLGIIIGAFEFIGGITLLSLRVAKLILRGKIHFGLLFQQMALLGVNSIPISMLVLVFAGGVFTALLAEQMHDYGADSLLGGLLLYVLIREFVPVFTGVVLAGKVGATITSEIGTMKISEQLDAMKALSTDPDWYLILPRAIAGVLMMPIVAVFAGFGGWYAGYLGANGILGMNYLAFSQNVSNAVDPSDFVVGFVKCLVFGGTIVLTACHTGLNAKGGAAGVGRAVTSGVVTNIALVFALDLVISILMMKF